MSGWLLMFYWFIVCFCYPLSWFTVVTYQGHFNQLILSVCDYFISTSWLEDLSRWITWNLCSLSGIFGIALWFYNVLKITTASLWYIIIVYCLKKQLASNITDVFRFVLYFEREILCLYSPMILSSHHRGTFLNHLIMWRNPYALTF